MGLVLLVAVLVEAVVVVALAGLWLRGRRSERDLRADKVASLDARHGCDTLPT
jgi:Tfp pilus assembly protein PilV